MALVETTVLIFLVKEVPCEGRGWGETVAPAVDALTRAISVTQDKMVGSHLKFASPHNFPTTDIVEQNGKEIAMPCHDRAFIISTKDPVHNSDLAKKLKLKMRKPTSI